jgi:hypothetical protein
MVSRELTKTKEDEMEYIVFEKQSVNDTRDESFVSKKNLAQTKRDASRNQMWQGTVLVIETKAGDIVAYKKPGERWTDIDI